MLRWLRQVNANGQKDDFHAYYDQVLYHLFLFASTYKTIQSYNNEAKQLVSHNTL